jgi:uncharacterized pyridoxamine 5'-phosphate oxidase family protein
MCSILIAGTSTKGVKMKGLLAVMCIAVLFALAVLPLGQPVHTQEKPAEADAVTAATGSLGVGGTDEVNMKDVLDFASRNMMGFFATVENGKPRVRAYSIMKIEGDTLYFGTDINGASYLQLKKVPYAEWISMDPQTWTALRIAGEVKFVEDMETKRKAIAENPMLAKMYAGDKEQDFGMFYLVNIEPNWFGIWEMPEELMDPDMEEGE